MDPDGVGDDVLTISAHHESEIPGFGLSCLSHRRVGDDTGPIALDSVIFMLTLRRWRTVS